MRKVIRRKKIIKNYQEKIDNETIKSSKTSSVSAGITEPTYTKEERINKINTELKELGLLEFNKYLSRYEYHIHINDYLKI